MWAVTVIAEIDPVAFLNIGGWEYFIYQRVSAKVKHLNRHNKRGESSVLTVLGKTAAHIKNEKILTESWKMQFTNVLMRLRAILKISK